MIKMIKFSWGDFFLSICFQIFNFFLIIFFPVRFRTNLIQFQNEKCLIDASYEVPIPHFPKYVQELIVIQEIWTHLDPVLLQCPDWLVTA